jgi:hypothetical protein
MMPAALSILMTTFREAQSMYGNEPAICGTLVVRENRHDPHSRLIAPFVANVCLSV